MLSVSATENPYQYSSKFFPFFKLPGSSLECTFTTLWKMGHKETVDTKHSVWIIYGKLLETKATLHNGYLTEGPHQRMSKNIFSVLVLEVWLHYLYLGVIISLYCNFCTRAPSPARPKGITRLSMSNELSALLLRKGWGIREI